MQILTEVISFEREVALVLIGTGTSFFVSFAIWFVKWLTSKLTRLKIQARIIEKNEYGLVLKFRFINASTEHKCIETIDCFIDGSKKMIKCENQKIELSSFIIEENSGGAETMFSLFVSPKTIEEHIYRFNSASSIEEVEYINVRFGKKDSYKVSMNNYDWQSLKGDK